MAAICRGFCRQDGPASGVSQLRGGSILFSLGATVLALLPALEHGVLLTRARGSSRRRHLRWAMRLLLCLSRPCLSRGSRRVFTHLNLCQTLSCTPIGLLYGRLRGCVRRVTLAATESSFNGCRCGRSTLFKRGNALGRANFLKAFCLSPFRSCLARCMGSFSAGSIWVSLRAHVAASSDVWV